MNSLQRIIVATTALLLLAACAGQAKVVSPVHTVPSVDLARYAGLWHEIARYPNIFQKGCRDSTANCRLRPDGEMDVINRCLKGADGKFSEVKGHAWPADSGDMTRLKVSFFWPFRSDYWIIDLGDNYEYAVVGTPDREYLWILAPQPKLSAELYGSILRRVEQQGFDPARLQ